MLNIDDALDYMPREDVLEEGIYMEEAGSGQVEIGKLQENIRELATTVKQTQELSEEVEIGEENLEAEPEAL